MVNNPKRMINIKKLLTEFIILAFVETYGEYSVIKNINDWIIMRMNSYISGWVSIQVIKRTETEKQNG